MSWYSFLTSQLVKEISLLPRKTAQNGQTTEAREKVKTKMLPGTLSTTAIFIVFSKESFKKTKQSKNQRTKTHIDRGQKVIPIFCG